MRFDITRVFYNFQVFRTFSGYRSGYTWASFTKKS